MDKLTYAKMLQKFLGTTEKEVPVVEQGLSREAAAAESAGVPATITKEGQVVGEGTSNAAPKESPILDASYVNDFGGNNPDKDHPNFSASGDAPLADVASSDETLRSKWDKLKGITPYAGVAGLGVGAAVLQGDGSSPQASVAPKVPSSDASFTPKTFEAPESEESKSLASMIAHLSKPGAEERVTIPAATPIDFGQGKSIANIQNLQDVQNKANVLSGLANLHNDSGLAYDIAGVERPRGVNWSAGAEGMRKQASGLLDQYKERVVFEKEDPNSPQSQGYRSLAGAMGFPVSGTASAADLEKLYPQLSNIYTQRMGQATRRDIAHENRLARMQDLQYRRAQLIDANLEKDRQKMGEVTNFDKQARGNAAQIRGLAQMGDRIDTLMDGLPKLRDGSPDLSKLTPIQKNELMGTFDTMLKGKSTMGGQKELMKSSDTVYSHIAQLQQYLSGNKAYTNEGGLMKSVADTVRREKGLAIEKVKDMAFEGASAFKRLRDSDPKSYHQILNDKAQISPADYFLREKGFRGNDINRFLNEGYTVDELANLAKSGKKASQIPSKMNHKPSKQPVQAAPPKNQISPKDVDNLSDEEVEAQLKARGL